MLSLNEETKANKKYYSPVNLFIRSLLFSIYSLSSIVVYSVLCLFTLLVPLRQRHAFIRTFFYALFFMLKFICRIDVQIEGLENVPKDQNGIIMCKHQSTWETLYLPLIFHDPAPIAKKELIYIPFFGWGLAIFDPILIDRNHKGSAMQQIINKGRKCLEQGRWIMVFPEGTRVPPGVVGDYKLGGARLAAATGYPVIPIAHNAGRCWPRRKFIKQPGTIKLVIGPLIPTKGRPADQILRETKAWIESAMLKIDAE